MTTRKETQEIAKLPALHANTKKEKKKTRMAIHGFRDSVLVRKLHAFS